MLSCKTAEDTRRKKEEIIREYKDIVESAMTCLDEGFEETMTVMALLSGMQRFFRTSNHIERLNEKLKRHSKVIDIYPNEKSLLRLMGSVLIERHEAIQSAG